jgi:hypothetical protein
LSLTFEELRKLALSAFACALLLAAGAALVWGARLELAGAKNRYAAARTEHLHAQERLMRIADEEREVKEKMEVYRRLESLGILGEEKRIDWAEAISRIRKERDLLDLRYRVERQKLLVSLPGKPEGVDFYASTLKVQIALLHEGDLLGFLHDLRESGNAYYAVRRCRLDRAGQSPASGGIAPRLRGECDIDLITILDRAAKT